jgi:hypothetical protein
MMRRRIEEKEPIVFLESGAQKAKGARRAAPLKRTAGVYLSFLGAFLSSFLAFFFMDGSFFRS